MTRYYLGIAPRALIPGLVERCRCNHGRWAHVGKTGSCSATDCACEGFESVGVPSGAPPPGYDESAQAAYVQELEKQLGLMDDALGRRALDIRRLENQRDELRAKLATVHPLVAANIELAQSFIEGARVLEQAGEGKEPKVKRRANSEADSMRTKAITVALGLEDVNDAWRKSRTEERSLDD